MATAKFTVSPGAAPLPDAPANPLTNIRYAGTPMPKGPRDLLARMTGSYTLDQRTMIAQTWLDLKEAGILAKLDLLTVKGLTEADSLLNWISADSLINSGCTWGAVSGFVSDGVDDYINMQYATLARKMVIGDATVFAYRAVDDGRTGQIFGRMGSGSQAIALTAGGANFSGRVFNTGSVSGVHGGKRIGLLSATNSGTNQYARIDGETIASLLSSTNTDIGAGGFAFGRDNTTFTAASAASFGYGAALTAEQLSTLAGALAALDQVI